MNGRCARHTTLALLLRSMLPGSMLLGLMLLGSLAPSRAMAEGDDSPRAARLSVIEGTVSVLTNGTSDWIAALPNQPLSAGDQVWSDHGARTEIDFGDLAVRLSGGAAVSLLTLSAQGVQVGVNAGIVELARHTADTDTGEWMELDAPQVALTVRADGACRISVARDGSSLVSVLTGRAEVAGRAGTTLALRDGQGAQFAADGTMDVATPDHPDDFDRWCAQREAHWQREYASGDYAPSEIPGSEQLADAGEWQREPDVGEVWFPYGVSSDWQPYQTGQWLYMPSWGWTWLDLAPWGFAPFHYGRWSRIGGRWGWVPPAGHTHPVFAGAQPEAPERSVSRQLVTTPARVVPPGGTRHAVMAMRSPAAQNALMPDVLVTPASRSAPLLPQSALLPLPVGREPTVRAHVGRAVREGTRVDGSVLESHHAADTPAFVQPGDGWRGNDWREGQSLPRPSEVPQAPSVQQHEPPIPHAPSVPQAPAIPRSAPMPGQPPPARLHVQPPTRSGSGGTP